MSLNHHASPISRLPALGWTAVACSTIACATAQQNATAPAQTVALQCRYHPTGLLIARACFEGRDGWFVFDTGASHNVIDERQAGKLRPRSAAQEKDLPTPQQDDAKFVYAQKLEFGKTVFTQIPFARFDLTFLQRDGVDLLGVLGYPMFASSILELDYRHARIVLHSREDFDDRGLTWQPLTLVNRQPCCEVHIEGHAEQLLIDSGKNGSAFLTAPTVKRLGLLENRTTTPETSAVVGGTLQHEKGRLRSLQVGGKTWMDAPVSLSRASTTGKAPTNPAGRIGCLYLDPFTVFLDCSGDRVAWRLHSAKPASKLADYEGRYGPIGPSSLHVRLTKGRLELEHNGQRRQLSPGKGDLFHQDGTLSRIRFVREGVKVTALEISRPGQQPHRAPRLGSAPSGG